MKDKDGISTIFGLGIAYLLPGLVGLYSLTFWSESVRDVFRTFMTAQSNIGLFLLVVSGAMIVGLQVNVFRYLLFERCIHKKLGHLTQAELKNITSNETKLTAYLAILGENFRYYQFYCGMVILLPLFYLGWSYSSLWRRWGFGFKFGTVTLGFIVLIVATERAARESFRRYIERIQSL